TCLDKGPTTLHQGGKLLLQILQRLLDVRIVLIACETCLRVLAGRPQRGCWRWRRLGLRFRCRRGRRIASKLRKFLQILLKNTLNGTPAPNHISGKRRRKFHAFGVERGNDSNGQKRCTQDKRSKRDNDSQESRHLFSGK